MTNSTIIAGYQSFFRGVLGNPWSGVDFYKERDWNYGWNKAYFENLEKVKLRERSTSKKPTPRT